MKINDYGFWTCAMCVKVKSYERFNTFEWHIGHRMIFDIKNIYGNKLHAVYYYHNGLIVDARYTV